MKKMLIMAGGTGGHIFPALTIADHCYAQGVAIYWLGSKGGMEERLVRSRYHLRLLNISGLRGKRKCDLFFAPFRITMAIIKAMKILRQVRPDVVLGMGGFVSGPGGVAARLLRIPLVIHEQNAIAGMTNRWLARVAQETLHAFPGAFPKRQYSKVVGNPIRQDIASIVHPQERYASRSGPVRILIIGGSRGAHAINQLMLETWRHWSQAMRPLIWHQTGEADFPHVSEQYQSISSTAIVQDFIADMASAYDWADIVVARAGALTVSELAAVGVASLLVPYPHAVDDHQTKNAMGLKEVGGSYVFQEKGLSVDAFRDALEALCQDRSTILTMALAAKRLDEGSSSGKVIAACENAIRRYRGNDYATME